MSDPHPSTPQDPPSRDRAALRTLAWAHGACCAPLLLLALITAGIAGNPWLLAGLAALIVAGGALALRRRTTRATRKGPTTGEPPWREETGRAERYVADWLDAGCCPPWLPSSEDNRQTSSSRRRGASRDPAAMRPPTTPGC